MAGLQPRRLGEIDPEPVAPTLVAAGHFGGGVAELLLDPALVDLGGRGQAGAQRVSGELVPPFALGQIAAHARRHRGSLDQPGDVLVDHPLGADRLAVAEHAAEQRPVRNSGEFNQVSSATTGQVRSLEPRPISTSRQPVLPRSVTRIPLSRISVQPVPSCVCRAPQSRPTISERRSPPAKPISRMARSRRPRRSPRSSVAIIASRSPGSTASFCSGGRPWVRRMPARTVATWRSARSNFSPRCAKFQPSAESRRSIVRTEQGFPVSAPEAQAEI